MQHNSIFARIPSKSLVQLGVDGTLLVSENGWVKYDEREPQCLKALFGMAYPHALKHLSRKATLELVCEFQRLITTGVTGTLQGEAQKNPGCVRETPIHFEVPKKWLTADGLNEFLLRERGRSLPYHALAHKGIDYLKSNVSGDELYEMLTEKEGVDYFAPFGPGHRQLILKEFARILDAYHQEISCAKSSEDKLFVIAKHIQLLELLHPFPDANGRTFANVLLFYWLLQNNFLPAMLYETNIFDLYSVKNIVEMIKEGMYCTRAQLEYPERPLFYDPTDTPKPDRKRLTEYTAQLKEQLCELDFTVALDQAKELLPYNGQYNFHLAVACDQVEKLLEYLAIKSFKLQMHVRCDTFCSPLLAGLYPIHIAIKLKKAGSVLAMYRADVTCLKQKDEQGVAALSYSELYAIIALISKRTQGAENKDQEDETNTDDAERFTRLTFK